MASMHGPMRGTTRRGAVAILLALPLAACGQRRAASPLPPPPAALPVVQLQVQSNGDPLEFTPKALQCAAGTHVRLLFHHTGHYVNFTHNWVLLRPGTYDAVIAASEAAGEERGWLPAHHPGIIAATPMCGRGQVVAVEFDAPPPGRYLYICTTPGHAQSMWGVLTITAA